MNIGYVDLAVLLILVTGGAVFLGRYIANVFTDKCSYLSWLETPIYRLIGTSANVGMNWKEYALSLVLFNIVGAIFLFVLQLVQGYLPLNPGDAPNLTWDLALNTAISFMSNTNWQAYSGETMMSYLTQMLGLATHNFMSGATGIAVAIALIRGFSQSGSGEIGNFWRDLVRATVYLLLPLSIVWSVLLISQGVPQNFSNYAKAHLIAPQKVIDVKNDIAKTTNVAVQTIPEGPIASQEAIKFIGTNGGGFFNANSAHPYENPTAISNWLEMLAMLIIPGALCFAFGRLVGDKRQGVTIYAVMTIVFILATSVMLFSESSANPVLLKHFHIDSLMNALQSGGNMEGKETRFGIYGSSLFSTITTAVSCGAVNTMHDSLMPLGGLVTLFLMQMSEVIYGGVGAGLYSILIFAILSVFIAGLMIGRTPEYLGKKIEAFEIKMTAIIILIVPSFVLIGTAVSLIITPGLAGISNPGAHGLSEVLYAFTSATNNNGSSFAGLTANSRYYNLLLALCMCFGRFGVIIPTLAIAGSLAFKKKLPVSHGTMPTTGLIFMMILLGVIVVVGALTYIPALALGPIAEQLLLLPSLYR